MQPDYLYSNAPLIEVIAEIRWNLVPLQSTPGAAVDPHFEKLDENLKKFAESHGFTVAETLKPPQTPLEFWPQQVVSRYRVGENKWPLFQVGPGIFSVNIVPPYGGWDKFYPTVELAVSGFFNSYPAAKEILEINRLELRYIDSFSEKHGYDGDFVKFVGDALGIQCPLPSNLIDTYASSARDVEFISEAIMPIDNPKDSFLITKIGPSKRNINNQEYKEVTANFTIRKFGNLKDLTVSQTTSWLNEAHGAHHNFFESITTTQLKQKMGPMLSLEALK